METILETLGDHAGALKDIDIVTEYVRQALKRTITRRFAEANSLRVITVDPKVEDTIVASVKKSEAGSYLAMDPDLIQKIVNITSGEIDKVKDVIPNIIILTSPIVKNIFKKLIDQFIPNGAVLQRNRQYGADTGYRQYSDVNAAPWIFRERSVLWQCRARSKTERAS